MVSWMKQRKGVKTQMHFSNNWIRYCSVWDAVVAGGEKCNGWGHCTTGFPIPQSHAADFAGVLRDWKDPVSSSLKASMESLKRLVRISLTVQESTLVQYFPGYSHLSAMLPISVSRGVWPGFPAQPPLCARAVLCFTSLPFTFPQWWGSVLYILCLLSQWGTWLLVLNVFPQHLKGIPEAHMPRHVPALFPLDPHKASLLPFSFLNQVSVYLFIVSSRTGWTAWIQNKLPCPAWWGSTSPSPLSLLPSWGNS